MISKTVELKNGNKWEVSNVTTDEKTVYESLTYDLIAKKINCCTYIKSIKRVNLYNGYQKITVTYDNKCRSIYQIENH